MYPKGMVYGTGMTQEPATPESYHTIPWGDISSPPDRAQRVSRPAGGDASSDRLRPDAADSLRSSKAPGLQMDPGGCWDSGLPSPV